jgi:hypothetical protein
MKNTTGLALATDLRAALVGVGLPAPRAWSILVELAMVAGVRLT